MTELTFADVVKLLNTRPSITDQEDNDLYAYGLLIDKIATDIFCERDDEYTKNVVAYIQSVSLNDCVEEGFIGTETAIALSKNILVGHLLSRAIKNTIGLAVLEELR